jgi:hypothetical protein
MENELLKKAYDKIEEMDGIMRKCMSEGMTLENQFKVADISNDYFTTNPNSRRGG